MDTKDLAKVFAALGKVTKGDDSREISRIHVCGETRVEATDGYCAVRVDLGEHHGLTPGLYAPEQSIALLKAGVLPLPDPAAKGMQFPDIGRVIPTGEEAPVAKIGMNPKLLSTALVVVKDVSGIAKNKGIVIEVRGAMDPLVIRAEGALGVVAALVMPMRM